MKTILEQLQNNLENLNSRVEARQEIFDERSEKWQESERG